MRFARHGVLVALPIALVFAGVPSAAQTFNFDTAFGRLPKNVVPIDYTIAVVPDAAAHTLTGTESIVLDVRSATSTIEFNTLNESLADVRLDGAAVATVITENDRQLTTVTPAQPARPGKHILSFAYTGKIESSPQGLFAQPYRTADGGDAVMLSTQFEATDARRMFPCWDEPAFRATFTLSVTVPAAWMTVANMPVASRTENGSLATTTFLRTPKMPTYLVEFSAGNLGAIYAAANGTQFGVVAVKGQENGGRVALANAQQILADYNDYFGYHYPLPKLDSIAIPGGFGGAMENWGAITYTDEALLLTPSSTIGNKQTVYSIQAHEMAHQWNGDLVTMGWWDDLWLNESFASWRAAKETDLRNPAWNWWENEDESKEVAMAADARVTSHPIQVHVANELEAETAFDSEITYAKGEAFLRMLEAYLGPDTFRDGVRRYMKARAFSNATGTDLWNALSAASHQDVASLSRAWTEQAGFPVVSVSATCGANGDRTIALAQQRFLLDGNDPRPRWTIPLSIRSGVTGAPRSLLLVNDGQTAVAGKCAEPLTLNAGTVGFFRVAYDESIFAVNSKNFRLLPNGDRIGLLDDRWALVRAGQAKLPSYLALAASMGGDLDARAWDQVVGALEIIERDERGTPGYDRYLAYARSIVKPLATQLGYTPAASETPDLQGLRRTAIGDLGRWGDADVIAEAQRRFATFLTDRNSIAPDDQSVYLDIVAANADAATFERLHSIAKSAKDETELRRYYGALTAVRDPKLADEAMRITMSPEIPPQSAMIRLDLVEMVANHHPLLSWQFVKQHYDELARPFGPLAGGDMAQDFPTLYWRGAPLSDITSFIQSKVPAGLNAFLARGTERARFDIKERSTIVPATDSYLATLHRRHTE